MSLKSKLQRLKPHMKHEEEVKKGSVPLSINDSVPSTPSTTEHGLTPYFVDDSYCLVRETVYPLETQHGRYQLVDYLKAVHAWNSTTFTHPLSAKGYNPNDLFFFDTETTGLGGGVGNTIFLLGQARFMGDHFLVKQHLLPKPGNEVALYSSFLSEVDYTALVTYNGKAFDWPQVKTRHTLVRDHVPKLPSFGHFDLFHGSRRLWKHKLERMKLSIVEEEVLGITRKDDVPGFLAPMIYYDYVETQNLDGMMGIMKHNEIDVISLITLYTHLTFQLLGIDQKQSPWESFEVGRWYSSLGDISAAEHTLTEVAAGVLGPANHAKWHLSLQYKKQKNYPLALPLWRSLIDDEDEQLAVQACVELAKWHEHKEKNRKLALDYSNLALEIRTKQSIEDEALLKRIRRLKRSVTKM